MGRTREFETDAVLDRAGALFWRLGYDVVSVQQLESATGLGRGSLYNAFGDKEGLFLAALDRYVVKHGSAPFRHLHGRDVGRGIRRMLDAIIERMSDPALPRGCLLVNASLVLGAGSRRIDAAVAGKVRAMEAALEKAIARARDDGQIPADTDPKQLARFYCAVVHSLGVTHRAMGDAAALRDVAAVAMRGWPGPNRLRRATAPRSRSGGNGGGRRRS
jgi:TetR/AcrR family transcriptional regulator, transcriptional repressor for nem operon